MSKDDHFTPKSVILTPKDRRRIKASIERKNGTKLRSYRVDGDSQVYADLLSAELALKIVIWKENRKGK